MPSAALQADSRDPFTFGPREGVTKKAELTLGGVLWDATRPMAIVGDALVGVGDRIGDWQVVQILQDGIVIQRDDRKEFLTPGSPIPPD